MIICIIIGINNIFLKWVPTVSTINKLRNRFNPDISELSGFSILEESNMVKKIIILVYLTGNYILIISSHHKIANFQVPDFPMLSSLGSFLSEAFELLKRQLHKTASFK